MIGKNTLLSPRKMRWRRFSVLAVMAIGSLILTSVESHTLVFVAATILSCGAGMRLRSINMSRTKRGNAVAKDLRSPKYAMRVVPTFKQYNRAKAKRSWNNLP